MNEQLTLWDPKDVCGTCAEPGMHPSHDASPRCESGGREHCSCDTCF